MISSTFTDLKEHRSALIKALRGHGLHPVVMEDDSALPDGDVIASSLQKVRDGSAYMGVISHKYGQVPECPDRNPDGLSLTELEFNEARRLGRPILLFIMGDDHTVKPADVELDPQKRERLKAFRESAKQLRSDSMLHRIYDVFNSVQEFERSAERSVAVLRNFLENRARSQSAIIRSAPVQPTPDLNPIPRPPAFYAEPPYIGSHRFIGRMAQLETLNDWALPATPQPILLFEAIGGTGKSMLTWEWTTNHATTARDDWAGRFWYSFYERGAIMADFCQRALAYITGQPLERLRRQRTAELGEQLLRHLQARPWLVILDGVERILAGFFREDETEIADNQTVTRHAIIGRDPGAAIHAEDDLLLRRLAAASPSKLLLTSRISPLVLLNAARQPIPGVLRESLPGVRPADAEALLRSCGVQGSSDAIQSFLKRRCDCHPLVISIVAGLVNDYLPARGNFDAWAADPTHGEKLNLSELDLVQKRNGILEVALAALPEKSHQLLASVALLAEAVDYPTLSALNPHLPPEPEILVLSRQPRDDEIWESLSDAEKMAAEAEHEAALASWQQSPEYLAAQQELTATVRDLERRSLLNYDRQSGRYDLHPVVRGIVAGRFRPGDQATFG